MPDIGWSELLVIAVIAIVVVGPKELPRLMAHVGRWSRAAQNAAREFRASLDQLAQESEIAEIERNVRTIAARADYPRHLDPTGGPARPPPGVLPEPGASYAPPAEEEPVPPAGPRVGERP